ncbi:MAG TPA: preprotein translocase subunit SecY [Dehalococcoidia bacterium]|nr:preprotein translocase subunit SecY [Dehalococcoidia bacterium]
MQRAQSGSKPKLFQAMIDAFRLPDLRRKLLFTFAMLVIFRFVAHVPVPGVDQDALATLFETEPLWGMLDLFSGGAMRYLSVAAMGVYPYITASIVMQLLVPVIPRLHALSREGEEGRRKINQYTHWLMVPMAMLQGYGQLILFQREGVFQETIKIGLSGDALLPTAAVLFSMVAGTVFLVWIGERITESGIGNGISIIIFGGIVAGLPGNIGRALVSSGTFGLIKLVILLVAITLFIVFVSEAVRRIPVQYSRSLFRGGRMYRQSGGTHIPMRVNSAGMIPLIFAYAFLMFPSVIAGYVGSVFIQDLFGVEGYLYWVLLFFLVVGFTFFYTMVIFQQQNLAETLQRQGGFIPGIRPGRPTADYLNRVIVRVTWGGAFFLAAVAVAPLLSRWLVGGIEATTLMLISAAGLLIVVGVVLDTMRQIEAQLLMRQYEGFIR